MTGLTVDEFKEVRADLGPGYEAARQEERAATRVREKSWTYYVKRHPRGAPLNTEGRVTARCSVVRGTDRGRHTASVTTTGDFSRTLPYGRRR